jgi:hypothetical protein
VPALETRDRLGGTDGNEILTAATAAVLTCLLVVEGVTVIHMRGLRGVHMFIGLTLIPPLLVKIGSTGYRFVRYYTGARAYREKGPPLLPLRMLAPLLVVSTIGIFVTGVVLLVDGHKSGTLLEIHKVSFIVWVAMFGIHFLAYSPRMLRSLRDDWRAARRRDVPGSGWRASLVAAAVGGGAALGLALLPSIDSWHA